MGSSRHTAGNTAVFLAMTAGLILSAGAAAQRDNVLLIVVDDVGVDNIAAYAEGANPPPTPNIDALARRGVLFRNAWVNPMCSTTRACIMTGRHSFRTGVGRVTENGLQPHEVTLPRQLDLRASGYDHAAIGKWHLSHVSAGLTAPNDAGWSHFAGYVHGFPGYFLWNRTVNGVASVSTRYATSEMTDDALAWIQGRTRPWVCYYCPASAHIPYHAPPQHLHTQNLAGLNPAITPRPFYRAMVEAMDTEIGRLLAGLGPELARTNVIFVSDNGTQGQVTIPPFVPGRGKGTPFEDGINVPLIVAGPIVASPNREASALVSAVDIYTTVLELAGVDPNPLFLTTDGVSMVPYLADPNQTPLRETVYAELFSTSPVIDFSCIRNSQYKLIRYRFAGQSLDLLYDLVADPFEQNNLATRPFTPTELTSYLDLASKMAALRTQAPGFEIYGPSGCLGTTGEPSVSGTGTSVVGGAYDVLLDQARPARPVLFLVGGSDRYFGALPLPLPLGFAGGGPNCTWLASAEILLPTLTDPLGRARFQVPVPSSPWLLGSAVFHQWLVLDDTAPSNPLGIVTTRGLKVRLGK